MKPLAIDLFCGLGGWTEGLLAEGYCVVGFDIERRPYPAQLVIQDVLTLHGSQFKDAALIVASPPCQEYSYMAMPWSRAKKIAAEYRAGIRDVARLKALFYACSRIQIEASNAARRYIPLVIENVRGAQPWVGMAKANFGSFYLWGDVGMVGQRVVGIKPRFGEGVAVASRAVLKQGIAHRSNGETNFHGLKVPGLEDGRFPPGGLAQGAIERAADGVKAGFRCKDRETGKWTTGWNVKNAQDYRDGVKVGGDYFSGELHEENPRRHGSKSNSRKAASAAIAKIPFPLAQHIARAYYPHAVVAP